jgi:hypothetical protein
MRLTELLVRCYAIKRGGVWEAFCIDLSLAAQADSFAEARRKLDEQIVEYITEAMTTDREHAGYLLSRKAPMSQFAMWYWLHVLRTFHALKQAGARLFTEPVPLVPANAL